MCVSAALFCVHAAASFAGLTLCTQAARMAEQMQNLKPEHLEKLLAVSSALQGGLARVRAARAWVSRNSVLVAALLVLLLALLVRRWLARRRCHHDHGIIGKIGQTDQAAPLKRSEFVRLMWGAGGCCQQMKRDNTANRQSA
jgi:hypothetical protein